MKLALPLLLLLALAAQAVEPKAVISGPKAAKPGTMVVLASDGSVYDVGGMAWTFIDGKCQAIEALNGQLAFVQGEPGAVTVALICVSIVDSKPKIALAKWVVVIGDGPLPVPPVPPGPTPVPPVPPGPLPNPAPDDRFHLAQVAVNASAGLSAQCKALLPALADNFKAVAKTKKGTTVDMQIAAYQLNKKTMGTLGGFAPLADALQLGLQDAFAPIGVNLTVDDVAQAYLEIAYGLRGKP